MLPTLLNRDFLAALFSVLCVSCQSVPSTHSINGLTESDPVFVNNEWPLSLRQCQGKTTCATPSLTNALVYCKSTRHERGFIVKKLGPSCHLLKDSKHVPFCAVLYPKCICSFSLMHTRRHTKQKNRDAWRKVWQAKESLDWLVEGWVTAARM